MEDVGRQLARVKGMCDSWGVEGGGREMEWVCPLLWHPEGFAAHGVGAR